jgi:hypothetical protein
LVERLLYTQNVGGSSPSPPTNNINKLSNYLAVVTGQNRAWGNASGNTEVIAHAHPIDPDVMLVVTLFKADQAQVKVKSCARWGWGPTLTRAVLIRPREACSFGAWAKAHAKQNTIEGL